MVFKGMVLLPRNATVYCMCTKYFVTYTFKCKWKATLTVFPSYFFKWSVKM